MKETAKVLYQNRMKVFKNAKQSELFRQIKSFPKKTCFKLLYLKMARLLLVLIVDGSENEQRGEQRRLCSRARAGGGAGGK